MMSVGISQVHQGMFSTLGTYHDECGDIMSTVGVFSTPEDVMSTLGVFSIPGDYHEYNGGIPRCMWGLS